MKLLPATPPPGPARPDFWRSPLRGARLTTILGLTLLVAITIVAVTGFLSHAAYQPDLGRNAQVPLGQDLQLLVIGWPTSPSWLYALTQGLHVTIGIVAVPILLAKLWSVIPRLFAWPPAASPARGLERLSALLLVGSTLFQFATGITNAELYYPWHFKFVSAHYYGAWVMLAAVALHLGLKWPTIRGALATRRDVLAVSVPDDLRAPAPGPETISRRGFLGVVAGAAGLLLVTTAGQSLGGVFRRVAIFAPRGAGVAGAGGFPVNKTAAVARITPALVGPDWRLRLASASGATSELSRAELLAMPQHTYDLPIACVEGWSTTQSWSGVRLADLARRAGLPDAGTVAVQSLQPRGAFRQTTLGHDQLHDDRALLALQVNGMDLPLDHGYPARVIVPALPGVHCTKWVGELHFG
jgi:DMSO/TMAO reductase YedYZ molybdopterin-dependent catalytic subunit